MKKKNQKQNNGVGKAYCVAGEYTRVPGVIVVGLSVFDI